MIQNEVLNAIRARRSTRLYEDRPVERELLNTVLEAATWAPSGAGQQSWLFNAIQSKHRLEELNQLVRKGFKTYTPDDDYPAKHHVKKISMQENYCFYFHAPVLIIASNKPHYENAMADCSLALQNIFLSAQSLGLGSCYINQLHWLREDPDVRSYLADLGVPREHTICSSAVIGYILKTTSAAPRREAAINIIEDDSSIQNYGQ